MTRLRTERAVLLALVLLAHGLALVLLRVWVLTERPSASLALQTPRQPILFSLRKPLVVLQPEHTEPVRPPRDKPLATERQRRAHTSRIEVLTPATSNSVTGNGVFADPAQEPAATISRDASIAPLRLDEQTIHRAIVEGQKGSVRSMAKEAGRLQDIDPPGQDKMATAIGKARVLSWRERSAALMEQADKAACGAGHPDAGGSGIGGDTHWGFTPRNMKLCGEK